MKRTVLDLSVAEARRYFLHASRYCTIKLPAYFDFQPLLNALDEIIGTQYLSDLKREKPQEAPQNPLKFEDPGDVENVNYKFLTNKDGNYAWRPLTIINPAIYVCMVNRMTEKDNWEYIQERFRLFQGNKRIVCYSIPIETEESDDQLKEDTASNIKNWWERIEQQSIELALEYNTVFSTDITDCYSSIYSHFIGTALHEEGQEIMNKEIILR